MHYDVAVIGAGVTGAATAWTLSRYRLNTVLIEQQADVCFGVSKANSGIIHGGFHHPVNTLKAKLEIRGNLMFERLHHELGFPFKRTGILVAAFSEDEMATVHRLYEQGIRNGVDDLEMCGRDRMLQLEPKLNPEVVGGFFCPGGGTVEPYRYVFSLVEGAQRNGVALKCNFRLADARWQDRQWLLTSSTGEQVEATYAVNAAGLYADAVSRLFGAEDFNIIPRKGEEYLLDRNSPARPSRVIFPVPGRHSKGVLVIPTAEGTTMIGPTADLTDDKQDSATTADNMQRILNQVRNMVSGISPRDIITSFAGLRPVMENEDFFIAQSELAPNLIQAAGIQSPGLTASPAIGEYIRDLLKGTGLQLTEQVHPVQELPHRHELRHDSPETIGRLAKDSAAWSNVVCRCEKISEAEIIEAVRHGHTTLDGVKFYTRAGMGRCQGGFCMTRIMKIISRESKIPMEELTKNGGDSRLVAGRLGDLKALAGNGGTQ